MPSAVNQHFTETDSGLPRKFSLCLPRTETGIFGGTVSLAPAAWTSYCHPGPTKVSVTLRPSLAWFKPISVYPG